MVERVLPFIIGGENRTPDTLVALTSYDGEQLYQTGYPSSSDIRMAKRALLAYDASSVPIENIIRVIRHAMKSYLASTDELRTLSRLTGSPLSYLIDSITAAKDWANNADVFLEDVFGREHYPVTRKRTGDGRNVVIHYLSRAPVIAILPRNEETVPLFVMIQLLLSRTPALIKTSAQGSSCYTTIQLVQSLLSAATELGEEQVLSFLQTYSVFSLQGDSKSSIVERLHVKGAQYLVFGSQKTIQSVSSQLETLDPTSRIIELGTGMSAAVVLPDADIAAAARAVVEGASADRGNKCTSTSVCYVHTEKEDEFLEVTRALAKTIQAGNPLGIGTRLGVIDSESKSAVEAYLDSVGHPKEGAGTTLHVVSLASHHVAEEVPGPVLSVRTFQTTEELHELVTRDIQAQGISKNLVTSVFCAQQGTCLSLAQQLPSHTVRWNAPTTAISLFSEHQGVFLVKEFVQAHKIELPSLTPLRNDVPWVQILERHL